MKNETMTAPSDIAPKIDPFEVTQALVATDIGGIEASTLSYLSYFTTVFVVGSRKKRNPNSIKLTADDEKLIFNCSHLDPEPTRNSPGTVALVPVNSH